MKRTLLFTFSGAIIGYLVSYFFQPKIVRMAVGFFTYCTDIADVLLRNKFGGLSKTVITSIVVFAIIGALLGFYTKKK